MSEDIYRTMKGYETEENSEITAAMEDYLEMILRLTVRSESYVRIGRLADNLGVRPSSASKMTSHLKECGYVNYEKYGYITLTVSGKAYAEYLMKRHMLLNRLLCLINGTESELKQVERTEHFFDRRTVENIERFLLRYPENDADGGNENDKDTV